MTNPSATSARSTDDDFTVMVGRLN
ncbi:MAG: hypothetical protein QOI86_906, partial [Actinomycetota bacterium]|nr:hypothetical protein [Actinomycetota bacterium]